MNQKITIDDLVAVVRVVRDNQKAQQKKINDLENKIVKLESDLEKEKKETDKRFDTVIERFESIETDMDDYVGNISEIEQKHKDVATKLTQVEEALKK